MRIILVGNDVLSPENLLRYLDESFLKAEICPCPSGPMAVEAAASDPALVVIAHMSLPGKEHGLDVLKQVKEVNPRAYTILVVRLSLYENLEAAFKEQVDWIMEIPLNGGKIRRLLRKTFRDLEDQADYARRQEIFHQINSSLIKNSERESALKTRAPV